MGHVTNRIPPTPTVEWTHPSVRRLANAADPIKTITEEARSIVMRAIDSGWTGPPFDPLRLADYLKINAIPNVDVNDARIIAVGGVPQIEYNPTRPPARRRYSVAHEIAHTLFPDYLTAVRNRTRHSDLRNDDWQLEMLCNLAAAEFLMPVGSFATGTDDLSIDHLLALRQEFQVSAEALFIRVARLTKRDCAIVSASQRGQAHRYRIDYAIPSPSWNHQPIGVPPAASVLTECTAIGYTAKADEQWRTDLPMHVESVGISPYPGTSTPRVLAILTPRHPSTRRETLTYLKGDATQPRGTGPRYILHVVNDKTPNWGGAFAKALRHHYPIAQDNFRTWASANRLTLGTAHLTRVADDLTIATMIAQRGYGTSTSPRLRYAALHECLHTIAAHAKQEHATVHMPRIGAGQAGGAWPIIEELLRDTFTSNDVPAFVYDLPNARPPTQQAIHFQA